MKEQKVIRSYPNCSLNILTPSLEEGWNIIISNKIGECIEYVLEREE